MNWKIRATMVAMAFGAALTTMANAQCGLPLANPAGHGMYKPASFALHKGLSGQLQDSFGRDRNDDELEPIVGMWKVLFVAKDSPGLPDGLVVDHGYSVWHNDNTEFLNSSRKPSTQNFCLGVWKKIGRSTYKLNHFALAFDEAGTQVGTVNIQEEVTVDWRRNAYKGSFSIDAYDLAGRHLPSDTPGNHANGVVTGERVTIYTRIE